MDNSSSLPASILALPLNVRAEMALREAIRGALEEKAKRGLPAYIWRDGKVVAVPPDEIKEFLAKPESPLATLRASNGASESGSKSG